MDNKYKQMTEKQMHKLADIIIAKLEIKQAAWDEEFHENLSHVAKEYQSFDFTISEEEMLIGELAKLQTILMIFEKNEEYEKAAIVLSRLNAIKTKLRKGDYNDD